MVMYASEAPEDQRQQRREHVDFPPTSELEVSHISGNPDVFDWVNRFVRQARDAGIIGKNGLRAATGINLCTEFSGSGCGEAALMTTSIHADPPLTVACQYAADIDPTCRAVLSQSCLGLSILQTLWSH